MQAACRSTVGPLRSLLVDPFCRLVERREENECNQSSTPRESETSWQVVFIGGGAAAEHAGGPSEVCLVVFPEGALGM